MPAMEVRFEKLAQVGSARCASGGCHPTATVYRGWTGALPDLCGPDPPRRRAGPGRLQSPRAGGGSGSGGSELVGNQSTGGWITGATSGSSRLPAYRRPWMGKLVLGSPGSTRPLILLTVVLLQLTSLRKRMACSALTSVPKKHIVFRRA